MDKNEMRSSMRLAEKLFSPHFTLNDEQLKTWYQHLQHYCFDEVEAGLRDVLATNKFLDLPDLINVMRDARRRMNVKSDERRAQQEAEERAERERISAAEAQQTREVMALGTAVIEKWRKDIVANEPHTAMLGAFPSPTWIAILHARAIEGVVYLPDPKSPKPIIVSFREHWAKLAKDRAEQTASTPPPSAPARMLIGPEVVGNFGIYAVGGGK